MIMGPNEESYRNGEFELVEWEDVNYCEHYFAQGDGRLSDKEVVDLLQQLTEENNALKNIIQHFIVKEFKITKEDLIKAKGGDATDFSSVIDEFFNNEVSISEIQVELETDKNKITKKEDYCNRNCIFYNAEYETRNNDTIVFKDCELRNSEIHEEYPLNFCEDYEK